MQTSIQAAFVRNKWQTYTSCHMYMSTPFKGSLTTNNVWCNICISLHSPFFSSPQCSSILIMNAAKTFLWLHVFVWQITNLLLRAPMIPHMAICISFISIFPTPPHALSASAKTITAGNLALCRAPPGDGTPRPWIVAGRTTAPGDTTSVHHLPPAKRCEYIMDKVHVGIAAIGVINRTGMQIRLLFVFVFV